MKPAVAARAARGTPRARLGGRHAHALCWRRHRHRAGARRRAAILVSRAARRARREIDARAPIVHHAGLGRGLPLPSSFSKCCHRKHQAALDRVLHHPIQRRRASRGAGHCSSSKFRRSSAPGREIRAASSPGPARPPPVAAVPRPSAACPAAPIQAARAPAPAPRPVRANWCPVPAWARRLPPCGGGARGGAAGGGRRGGGGARAAPTSPSTSRRAPRSSAAAPHARRRRQRPDGDGAGRRARARARAAAPPLNR